MHGNAWPSEEAMRKKYLVVGHRHFAVDSNGRIEKAWLFARRGKADRGEIREDTIRG